jgi:type II secretory pathway pseudopilin PulG
MKHSKLPLISLIASLLIFAIAGAALLIGLSGYADSYSENQLSEVRDTVLSYVAQCYALEGEYPPDLDYLAENYGLQLDTERYIYHYDMYASNILPDVRVFLRKAGEL